MSQSNIEPEREHILTINNSKEEEFLRRSTNYFDFGKHDDHWITQIINRMKKVMRAARGVGLSANQIGLSYRLFVAEVPTTNGDNKFYALFNPTIEKSFINKSILEEGCLSIPNTYGKLKRHDKVILKAQDKKGRVVRIKAWGLLAQVFQHEIGHLNGELFIDHAIERYTAPVSLRLSERERFDKDKKLSQSA